MKLMKWMTVTALATATVFGSFVESAEANIIIDGIRTKGNLRDETDVKLDYEFRIFSKTPTGTTISDTDGDLSNTIGTFPNVVKNFTGRICDDNIFAGFNNILISVFDNCSEFNDREEETIPALTLDLKARLISEGDAITLPNSQQVFETADGGGTILSTGFRTAENDRIEYVFTSDNLEDLGIAEFALIINDFNNIDDIDQIQAVNSLDYIIENYLFGKVDRIRISGQPSQENILKLEMIEELDGMIPEIVSSESSLIEVQAEVELTTVTVPESSSKNSLLALGILGVGLRLKRKLK